MSYFSDFSDPSDPLPQGWQIPFDQKMNHNRGSRINMPGINLSPRGTFNLGTNRQSDQNPNINFDSPFGNPHHTFGTQGKSAFGAVPGWGQNLLSGFEEANYTPSFSSPASYSSSPVRGGLWPRERNEVDREIPIIRDEHNEDNQNNSYGDYTNRGQYQDNLDIRDIPIQVCRGPSPSPIRRGGRSSHNQHASHSPPKDDSYHMGRGGYNTYRGRGGGARGATTSHGVGRGGGLGGRRTPSPNKTNQSHQQHHQTKSTSPKMAPASPPPHYAQPLGHDHQRSHDEAHARVQDTQLGSPNMTTPSSPKSLSSVREIPIITTRDARRNLQRQQQQEKRECEQGTASQQRGWKEQMDGGAERLEKVVNFNHRPGQKGSGDYNDDDENIPIQVERVGGNGCGGSKVGFKDSNQRPGRTTLSSTKADNSSKAPSRAEGQANRSQADASPPPADKVTVPPNPETVVGEITTHLKNYLQPQVDAFQGGPGAKRSKEFLYLDDALTKALIKLDAIDAGGDEGVRKLRRDAVHAVDQCAAQLETKARMGNDESSNGGKGKDQEEVMIERGDDNGVVDQEGYATPPTPNDPNLNPPSSTTANPDVNSTDTK